MINNQTFDLFDDGGRNRLPVVDLHHFTRPEKMKILFGACLIGMILDGFGHRGMGPGPMNMGHGARAP